MNFNLTEEQVALQDTLRRFVTKDYGFEQRRALAKSADGFSRKHWQTLAELGVLALQFPSAYGGLDGTGVDTMLVMEAIGRGLVLEPYLATVVLAGGLIRDAGSDAQREKLLPAIAQGELLLALAHQEPGARYAFDHVATKATADGAGWRLSGHKAVVLSAPSADRLLVSARTRGGTRDAQGVSLFLVDRAAPGATVRGYATQDGGRAAEVVLNNVRVEADALVGAKDAALPALERAFDYGIAALCAEAVGIMTALNETTLEYLKTRKQFGVPIGKFQALQHRMADMVINTEQARSMALLAAVKVDAADRAERRR
ncbi:MAG TPA: acyl-CoA dehydrogenase, partial [Burkholderiaceae bacterium]|nr:acyl-CoA dehydrogenase [Burkholderiaceae bacterium]